MFRSPWDQCQYMPVAKVKTFDDFEDEEYCCDLCSDGDWTSETEVEIHKAKKHYDKAFMDKMIKRNDYCYICIKKFPDRDSTIEHIKTEHLLSTANCLRVEREIFICHHCSTIFFNRMNLVIHMHYTHSNTFYVDIIKCILCYRKIKLKNMSTHFNNHNIQSVSTCRICLSKYKNTKALREHLLTHPYYLKCEMCQYDTNRVDSFQNHILLKHRTPPENLMTKDEQLMAFNNEKSEDLLENDKISAKELITDDEHGESISKNDDDMIEMDLITVIEISDMDAATDDLNASNNLMTNECLEINKGKREKKRSPIKKKKKKTAITRNNATALHNLVKDYGAVDTISTKQEIVPVKDLTENTISDSKEEIKNNDLTTDVKSKNITTITKDWEISNFADASTVATQSDSSIEEEVINDSNLMTVVEVSDQDLTTYNVASNALNWNSESQTVRDELSNLRVIKIADDKNVQNDENVMSNVKNVTIADIKIEKMKKIDDFKRFFVPDHMFYSRLQRVVGLKGLALANDIHICILCREVCVSLEEMRSHIYEHTAFREEKSNGYDCSCGEHFTNKVLLKHHAFKNNHAYK